MSEIVVTVQARDIRAVTTEIRTITRQTQQIVLTAAIEIGRRLKEAKAMVPHGEWGDYLKQEVEFYQSSAQNFMRLFEEYGDKQESLFAPKSQALEDLPYTKALRLLAVPAEERAQFVEDHNVADMSTRQLEQALKDLEESRRREADAATAAGNAEAARSDLEKALDHQKYENGKLKDAADAAEERRKNAQKKVDDLKKDLDKARSELKAAREAAKNPAVPDDVMAKIRQEAEEAAAAKAAEDAQKAVEAAEKKAQQAEADAKAAREALEKARKTADTNVTVFKTNFEQIQRDFETLKRSLDKVAQDTPETAAKLRRAVNAVLDKFREELGE